MIGEPPVAFGKTTMCAFAAPDRIAIRGCAPPAVQTTTPESEPIRTRSQTCRRLGQSDVFQRHEKLLDRHRGVLQSQPLARATVQKSSSAVSKSSQNNASG